MKTRQLLKILLILLFVYVAGAYFLAPDYWKHYNHHPELEGFEEDGARHPKRGQAR